MATTTKGFPYPEGGDVPDVDGDIQALAEACDDLVPRFAGGSVTITLTSESNDSESVSFPVGRFTTAPLVQATINGGSSTSQFVVWVSSITTSGCVIGVRRRDDAAVTATVQVAWLAVE